MYKDKNVHPGKCKQTDEVCMNGQTWVTPYGLVALYHLYMAGNKSNTLVHCF